MKLLIGTHCSNDNNCGCDYAIVDLTQEGAKALLRKIDIVQKLREEDDLVSCVEFHAPCDALYLECCDEIEAIQTDENKLADSVWNADTLPPMPDDYLRTECDRLVIYANWNKAIGPTVFWRAVPKHTDVEVETDYIPVELIKKIGE